MKRTLRLTVVLLLILAQVACASSKQAPDSGSEQKSASATQTAQANAEPTTIMIKNDPHLGPILADAFGWTLYTYEKDSPGVTSCSGSCEKTWPPLLVPAGTTPNGPSQLPGKVGLIKRQDGSVQVTYNQLPLYRYSGDASATDTRGENLDGEWGVIAAR
jgi:predicted lipoprotein with Yx(FWY)xxD motif